MFFLFSIKKKIIRTEILKCKKWKCQHRRNAVSQFIVQKKITRISLFLSITQYVEIIWDHSYLVGTTLLHTLVYKCPHAKQKKEKKKSLQRGFNCTPVYNIYTGVKAIGKTIRVYSRKAILSRNWTPTSQTFENTY